MRTRLTSLLVAAALLAGAAPVLSVTNGVPDGTRHPYVGLVIQFIPGTNLISVCSGSALSDSLFLTARHCADPAEPVFVTYKPGPPFSLASDFTEGVFHPHPLVDVAVVTLNVPRDPGVYAVLPAVGLVDALPQKTFVDLVGYGVQGFNRGGGPPQRISLLTRFFAPSQLLQSRSVFDPLFVTVTANPAQGKGGVCFGDSGGPVLVADTDIVLAVNSFALNPNCTGLTFSTRVDLQAVQDFIGLF